MISAWPGRTLALCAFVASACGARVPQSPECAHFLACLAAVDKQVGRRTNAARFEPDGACWGGPAGAKLCTESCERGLPLLTRDLASVPEVCRP